MVSWGNGEEGGGAYFCHRISLFLRGVVLGGARRVKDVFCEGSVKEGEFGIGLQDLLVNWGEHRVWWWSVRCLRRN